MGAPLVWTASQAPRFYNYRAPTPDGTLCLDHPDAKGRIGLRYEMTRGPDDDLAACIARAVASGPDSPERARARAMIGIGPRLGWFANLEFGRRALAAALAPGAPQDARALIALGFRPWPRPGRAGAVQGYRWQGPHGRLTVLVGPDRAEIRHKPAGRKRRRILMRLSWTGPDGAEIRHRQWPTALSTPAAALTMAAAIAAAIREGGLL